MRFITFKALEGKNFLSFGDTPIQVNLRPGVNAIIGTNYDKEDSLCRIDTHLIKSN